MFEQFSFDKPNFPPRYNGVRKLAFSRRSALEETKNSKSTRRRPTTNAKFQKLKCFESLKIN